MSVFASDVDGDDHVRRANAVGGAEGGDSNFLVERPIQQANLIEEEDAAETERTFSDGGAELSEGGDQETGEAAPLIGQGGTGQREPDEPPPVQAPSRPGVFSRAWAGIKRGVSSVGRGLGNAFRDLGFGRIFGDRRAAPDPSDLGAAEEASARREYQASGGRTVDDTRFRQVVGPSRPWMARLFGAGPGGRGSANAAGAAARGAVELDHLRGLLGTRSLSPGMQAYQASRGRGPDVPFMAPTPDNVKYGEQKERRPVGFTPNSSWAVRPHSPAASELLGANRGVSKSGSMPSDALDGLGKARQDAEKVGDYTPPGMIRGADQPELRVRVQERRLKSSRVVSDLAKVDPQAGAHYRMNRTWQKANAALGANNVIGEADIEDEEADL